MNTSAPSEVTKSRRPALARRGNERAPRLRDLYCHVADAAGRAVDQHARAAADACEVAQRDSGDADAGQGGARARRRSPTAGAKRNRRGHGHELRKRAQRARANGSMNPMTGSPGAQPLDARRRRPRPRREKSEPIVRGRPPLTSKRKLPSAIFQSTGLRLAQPHAHEHFARRRFGHRHVLDARRRVPAGGVVTKGAHGTMTLGRWPWRIAAMLPQRARVFLPAMRAAALVVAAAAASAGCGEKRHARRRRCGP